MDGICGAILDEESEESVNAVNQVDDQDTDGDKEDGESAAHTGGYAALSCGIEAVVVVGKVTNG